MGVAGVGKGSLKVMLSGNAAGVEREDGRERGRGKVIRVPRKKG